MRILQAKLKALTVLPLLFCAVTLGVESWSYRALGDLYPKGILITGVSTATFRLVGLTYEYRITRGERAASQWQSQYAEGERFLRQMPMFFDQPAEQRQVEALRRSYDMAGIIFDELLTHDQHRTVNETTREEAQLRTSRVNRLIFELETVTPKAERMHREVVAAMQWLLRFRSQVAVCSILALSLSMLGLSFWLTNGIRRSLTKLRRGVQAVADGDLGFRVDLDIKEELGELGRGFDAMTDRLAGMTVSRDALVREREERRQAEEALAASERQLREAQRIAQLGSWELDLTSNVLLWSEEIYRIFEIDPNSFDATYEAFLAAVHPEDRDLVDRSYRASLTTRRPYELVHRLLMPDGRIKHVHERGETAYDDNGVAVLTLGTVQDITSLRQVEDEVRALNEQLELRVAERTRSLEIKTREVEEAQQALMNIVEDLNQNTYELQQANLRLQDVDRLKSMFIATMSHELRTPLNSVIGFSSIVMNEWLGPLNDEQKAKLAIVLRTGKHLLALINDLIDVSKIEAGKLESIVEAFDLYDLIAEAASLTEPDAAAKGLELKVEALHLAMQTDRRRLNQCVINLLGNAVKFTRQGSIVVTARRIGEMEHRGEGEMVAISVRDTGIGIKEEDLPKLFTSFLRLPLPDDMQVKGTGLGLYLVKKIATEILGGTVAVTSDYGQGSEFRVTVPVALGVRSGDESIRNQPRVEAI